MAPPPREVHAEPSAAAQFWRHKPWWCQPWTILLTGGMVLAVDAVLFLRFGLPLWLALPPLLAILAWWILFLLIVPSAAQGDAPH
ncbi:MAG: hypothetical protein FJ083_08485 [Cyanobacteria bacterium K_Offshore_surface_m2_239]|nr:hypothetical protein [Cyanobacteria bacterium K_Offshore_surface_m2_239]